MPPRSLRRLPALGGEEDEREERAAREVATVASLPPHVAASDRAGGADLMASALREFDLPLDRIGGHHPYAESGCPGQHLRRPLEDGALRRMVAARLTWSAELVERAESRGGLAST